MLSALFSARVLLPRANAAHASRTHDGNVGCACVEVKASIETLHATVELIVCIELSVIVSW